MGKFLIIQTAFIGDVILATPLIKELARIYPNAQIDFLVRKGNESLLANNPNLNQVYIFDKSKKLKNMFALIKVFRRNNYDEVINLQRFASSGLITAFSGAKVKVGFKKNPISFLFTKKINHEIGNGLHEVERNLLCLKHHGANNFAKPEIFPSKEDYHKIVQFQSNNYFCLAPASIWFTKQLPENKWVELGVKLSQKGIIYLVGGPNDEKFCEKIKDKINSNTCVNLAGKLSFLESAALFQGAKMNFVNDSGPLHFCSAINAPVSAFFCSTSPDFGFGPLSDVSNVIESKVKPSCKPCGLHGFKTCPEADFVCGNEIEISKISI